MVFLWQTPLRLCVAKGKCNKKYDNTRGILSLYQASPNLPGIPEETSEEKSIYPGFFSSSLRVDNTIEDNNQVKKDDRDYAASSSSDTIQGRST